MQVQTVATPLRECVVSQDSLHTINQTRRKSTGSMRHLHAFRAARYLRAAATTCATSTVRSANAGAAFSPWRSNLAITGPRHSLLSPFAPLAARHVTAAAGKDTQGNGGYEETLDDSTGSGVVLPVLDRVEDVELHNEASKSYLAYAMSVIVGRALPDARDGLKPVHRRILYSMLELGMTSGKPFRKSARVVGEVLGKYHPHGDQAVYDALVRLAQDFSMREPLINGHGNFGSQDADPPAAMRYTECKLRPLAEAALLSDISADTVNFVDNFDGSRKEPTVLPSAVPQLLVNGSTGIAVGMATSIPPHNLREVVGAMCHLVDYPDAPLEALMAHLQAPDFPTGGLIMDHTNELAKVYTTGRGNVMLRGKAFVETVSAKERGKSGQREAVIITEIPYMTNKATLVERIAHLVNSRVLDGVADVRDESDRSGMRVVVELKRSANASVVMNNLYKHTKLQTRVSCIMIAVVNNQPVCMSLHQMLKVFIDFRVEVIQRRTQFHLDKAIARDHIVQGLLIALESLDAVVETIRQSDDASSAAENLSSQFGLTKEQTDAVLSMPLRRLTGLEKGKLEAEHTELVATIADLEDLLLRKERVLGMVKQEAKAIASKHGSDRRTEVLIENSELQMEELLPNSESIVVLSERGFIKRMPLDTFSAQNRGTRGKTSGKMRDNDAMLKMVQCRDHDQVLLFSEKGAVYSVKAYQIPECSRTASGTSLNQLGIVTTDQITSVTTLCSTQSTQKDESLLFLTSQGKIKKTLLSEFKSIYANGKIAITLEEGDKLQWVTRTTKGNNDSIIIAKSNGQVIHFKVDEEHLRSVGRAAKGVNAMFVDATKGEGLVGMAIVPRGGELFGSAGSDPDTDADESGSQELDDSVDSSASLLFVTQNGIGKRVPITEFRQTKRGGKGVIGCKFRAKDDRLVSVLGLGMEGEGSEELLLASQGGLVNRFHLHHISLLSRSATGSTILKLNDGDIVRSVALAGKNDEDLVEG